MQMDQEMKNGVKKNKYGFSDPNAAIGFTRGMDVIVQPTPEEEERIRQENEMPPVSAFSSSFLTLLREIIIA